MRFFYFPTEAAARAATAVLAVRFGFIKFDISPSHDRWELVAVSPMGFPHTWAQLQQLMDVAYAFGGEYAGD